MEFILRPISITDLYALVEYANNLKIASNMTDGFPHPYTKEAGEKFINMATQGTPPNIMAIDIDGKLSGAIGLHAQTDVLSKSFELGYWLAEPFWSNGIITRAVQQMIVYGFEHWDVNRIFARPYGPNIGSQRVLEKCGFRKEGFFKKAIFKNGIYLDLNEYAILRSDLEL